MRIWTCARFSISKDDQGNQGFSDCASGHVHGLVSDHRHGDGEGYRPKDQKLQDNEGFADADMGCWWSGELTGRSIAKCKELCITSEKARSAG